MTDTILQDTIKRQAKRLRDQFNIDLTLAKQVLARGPYGCASWEDLCVRLKGDFPSESPLQMATLPDSPSAMAYLAKNLCAIARSISQQILTNRNLAGLCEALRQIFAVPGESISLADVLPNLHHTGWQPAHIGPDPHAVIHAHTQVNGAELLLIGTRIYWPELFTFDPQIKTAPKAAEPIYSELRIMWQVEPWYQAARDYLLEYQREDDWDIDLDLVEPEITEDCSMQRHNQWLSNCLQRWSQERYYNEEGEQLIPYLFQGHAYLVFGVPCATRPELAHMRDQRVELPGEDSNRWQVVLLDHQPICLEWLSVPKTCARDDWDYSEYYWSLQTGLLAYQDSAHWSESSGGYGHGLLFVVPACHFSLRHQMTVDIQAEPQGALFTLRTDVPELALEVLERATTHHHLVSHASDLPQMPVTMQLDITDRNDCSGLSLSLDIVEMGRSSSSHLIIGSYVLEKEGRRTLHVEVTSGLFDLVACEPMKALRNAVIDGRVQRAKQLRIRQEWPPVELEAQNEQVVTNTCEVPSLENEALDFDLFHDLCFSRIRYSRDNF